MLQMFELFLIGVLWIICAMFMITLSEKLACDGIFETCTSIITWIKGGF